MMPTDLADLRAAVEAYRAAAAAAGVRWPDRVGTQDARPPGLVFRLFDVDHVAGQLSWLQSQGWGLERLFPEGGWLLPWPSDPDETLQQLHFSIGTPFSWRHQMPVFHFEQILYTFVLAGPHEGEVWRYDYDPDAWASVRAATGLTELFTQWTRGLAAEVVFYADHDRCLHVGDDIEDPLDVLRARAPDLDPLAFPVPISDPELLGTRQAECGVDLDCIRHGPDCHDELLVAIDAVRASLS